MIAKKFRLILFVCISVLSTRPVLYGQQAIYQKGSAAAGSPATGKTDPQPAFSKLLNAIPPEMVAVAGGTFSMGCTPEQNQALIGLGFSQGCATTTPTDFTDATPAHEVTLPNFLIGKYEVTQADWFAVMGSSPSFFNNCGGNCPVENVTWFGAAVFCNRLSEMEGFTPCYYTDAAFTTILGKNGNAWSIPTSGAVHWNINANGYRLPTEAEWEYAARGGGFSGGYRYAGDNLPGVVAWYAANSPVMYMPNVSGQGTHPTGTKNANELNLFDMSGNVLEWCFDWYQNNHTSTAQCLPTGAANGTFRVMRGGAWFTTPELLLVGTRNFFPPNADGNNLGFRLARTP